jgi:hypothetical protein
MEEDKKGSRQQATGNGQRSTGNRKKTKETGFLTPEACRLKP